MKICTRSLLCTLPALAATAGVGLVATTAQAEKANGPVPTADTFPVVKGAIPYTGGGIAGGGDPSCSWDNGGPAVDGTGAFCGGSPATQFDAVYPFYAEAADDFMLVDDGNGNPCEITNITWWFVFFNGSPVPGNVTGYRVTIYEDMLNAGDPTLPPNFPAGTPNADGTHTNALVEAFVPAPLVTLTPVMDVNGATIYRADMPTSIVVEKDVKLWMAIAPELIFPPQIAWTISNGVTGKRAEQIFELLALPWTLIGGGDCDGDGTADALDLAFNFQGQKFIPQPPFCPWDCGDNNGNVGVPDLLALLAQWGSDGPCNFDGGVVGTTDLLKLLAAWGDCPPAVQGNDECADAVTVFGGANEVDLKGTTPSDPDPICTVPGGDGWYTYSCLEANRVLIVSTVDVFLEVYDACGGALIDCAPAQLGVGPINMCGPGPDGLPGTPDDDPTSVVIRLINDLGLPNDKSLKGDLFITELPPLAPENCNDSDDFVLNDGDTVFNDTTGAPDSLDQSCGGATDAGTGANWYQIIGDGTTWTASTCNPGTQLDFDAQVSVFCGDCDLQLICIAGANDNCGGANFLHAEVSFCTVPGKKYYIVVHGGVGGFGSGTYELTVNSDGVACNNAVDCGPTNDECVDAIKIFDGLTPFETLLATTGGPQNGDPTLCSGGNANPQCVHDIWYIYEATCSAQLTIDTCEDLGGSADYDTDIWVYGPYASQDDVNETNCANDALNANVAECNDDATDFPCGSAAPWHSVARLDVIAGEFYIVRVGGWATEGGDLGTGVLQISCEVVATGACCNADGTCTDNVSESTCVNAAGTWFGGQTCLEVEPCPSCEFSQRRHAPNEGWTFGTTDQDISLVRYEQVGVATTITSIRVWGIDAFNDGGGFAECAEIPQLGTITFYADAAGAPGAVNATASGVNMGRAVEGTVYAGAFTLNVYDIPIGGGYVSAATDWVSIQGEAPGDMCWFLWLSSPEGDGLSYREDQVAGPGVFLPETFDLSICINPTP